MEDAILAVTVGDPAGIGPEIVLKSFQQERGFMERAVVVGDLSVLEILGKRLDIDVELEEVQSAGAVSRHPECVSVLNTAVVEECGTVVPLELSKVRFVGGEERIGHENCQAREVRATVRLAQSFVTY